VLVDVEVEGSAAVGMDSALMSIVSGTRLVVVGRAVRLGTRGSGLRHVLEVKKNGGRID
jgi:hypothetical protein